MRTESQAAGPRERLLATAFRVLEEQGASALRTRELTAANSVSTMAIYTHFGGMPGLVEEMVREGLAGFADHVRATTPQTEDPMRDLIAGGMAYSEFALQHPQLYRLMFGISDSARLRGAVPEAGSAGAIWTVADGSDAFSVLLGSVERVIEAGRFRPQDATAAATQILSLTHGFLLLAIGGLIGDTGPALRQVMFPAAINLMVGLGDERERVEESLAAAAAARPSASGRPQATASE